MKASKFATELNRVYGASLVLVDGRVQVQNVGKLSRNLKVVIVRHRPALQAWLVDGTDVELDEQRYNPDELLALGCVEILTEEVFHDDGSVTQRWTWTHADGGDEQFDNILVGLLDAGEIKAQRKQAETASKEAVWSKAHPPIGRIFGRL